MVTSEEVMGEMVLREGAPHTPTGKVPQRRLSNDCRYFGSLKKRWLIQYDRHTPFDIQPRNGLSTCIMSNCLNDTSIQKRAEQIASYVFKTPKSVTLSKKHRMRETMLYASEYLKEITRDRSYGISGDLAEKTEPISVDNSSSPTKEGPNLASETTISTTVDFVERLQSYDPTDSLEKPCMGTTTVSVNNEHSASEKTHIESKIDSTDSLNEKLLNATDCNDTNVCTDDERTLHLKKEYKTSTQHQVTEGNQLVTNLVLPDIKNGSITRVDKERKIRNISNSINSTYLPGPLLTGSSDNALAFANSDLNEQEHDHRNSNGKFFSYAPMDETDQQKTLAKVPKVSVNDSFAKFHVNTVATIEGSAQKTESAVIDLPMHAGDVRALSILRDPRLSSSSSRSSRDSTDGNILVRSDSVSSLEDVSLQRANVDKKSINDKTDGMRHAKKKMSLREYRNRKKTKPAATLIHGASTINEGLAAKTLSQSILFTDTDSLLTPRTLSLSTGFTPLSGKDVTLTTSSSDSVSMTTLMSSQIPIQTPSTEPLFEPVSPSEDFVAETMPNDEVKPGTSLSYQNFPLVAHDLQPHEFMEVDGEVTPVTSQAIVCQPESETMSRKDPRKHYNYNPTQILTQQTTNFSYHSQELQSSLQRSKNIGSNSPIYRQAQTYNQHFRG
ncbi:uncharacterized protein LOC135692444 [Rhopilema esculentum]|uniref:uncharacterized protein LOC135692444 n=1 Tax=Rhopilema esculentum TaxID=499914 RepID=UPI0031DAADCA